MNARRITVGTAAGGTLVAANTQHWHEGVGRRLEQHVKITTLSGTVYLDGGTTVSVSTGFPLVASGVELLLGFTPMAGAALAIDLDPGEELYAIAGATAGTIAVLQSGD